MTQSEMTIETARAHAGLTAALREEVEERAMQALPKYMWVYKVGKEKRGYCSACRCDAAIREDESLPAWAANDPYLDTEESPDIHHPEQLHGMKGPYFKTQWNNREAFDNSGKHGHFGVCPACGELVQFRSLYRGRKTLKDRIFLIQYKRSEIDENALVMLGFLCRQDWGSWDDYNDTSPEMDVSLREICVFRPGRGGDRFVGTPLWEADTRQTDAGLIACNQRIFGIEWRKRKKCVGGFDPICGPFNNPGTRFILDTDALEEAIAGTRWEAFRAMEDRIEDAYYCPLDLIDVFHFIARWPSVEYLCKLGFGALAADALNKTDEGAINLRGKTAQRVFRVDGNDWGWIKGHKEDITLAFLQTLRLIRGRKLPISCETLANALRLWHSYSIKQMLEHVEAGREAQALKWCVKNTVNPGDYADYLLQLAKLRIAARDKAVLYPREFQAAHRRLSERIKAKENAKQDGQIAARIQELGEYWFSALGLTLRPMVSSGEIIREGEMMQHCVGGYVKRYAEGGTILLCLREDERPTTPYRTVEFSRDGKMVQCRGKRNQSPEDEQERINQFWALFEMYRKDYARQHQKKRKRRAA